MAVTFTAYNDGKMKILDGAIDLDTDTFKLALCTSTYTPNIDSQTFFSDVTNECTGTGYTAGGETLGSKTVTADDTNDRGVFDGADVSWAGLTLDTAARYAVLYKSTGTASTSPLVGYIDFGTTHNPSGGTLTISWHADGILYI